MGRRHDSQPDEWEIPTRGDIAQAEAEARHEPPTVVPARIRALVGDDPRTPEAQPPDLATFVAGLK